MARQSDQEYLDQLEETLTVPARYKTTMTQMLANMMLQDEAATVEEEKEVPPEPEKTQEFEVTKILEHQVSKDGKWSFRVEFKGWKGDSWWIDDDDCDCELHVREYMDKLREPLRKTIYCICRVSSKNQTGPTHVSLKVQEKELRKTALALYGKQVRLKFIRISASAYKGIPTAIRRVGESACSGDAILIYRVDRLSRNIVKYLSWLEDLNDRGVRIFSQDENIWYDEDKLDFIQGIVDAHKEAFLIGKRVRASIKYRQERGDAIGSVAYGYKRKQVSVGAAADGEFRRVIVEDVEEQELIRRIRETNGGYETIADELNYEGLRKRGKMWTAAMVRSLKN